MLIKYFFSQINFEPGGASDRLEKWAKTYGRPCMIRNFFDAYSYFPSLAILISSNYRKKSAMIRLSSGNVIFQQILDWVEWLILQMKTRIILDWLIKLISRFDMESWRNQDSKKWFENHFMTHSGIFLWIVKKGPLWKLIFG